MPDASRAETSCHSSPFLLARSRSGLCGLVLSSWDTTHLYSSLEVLRASAEQVHFQVLGRAARHASLSLSPVTNCCTSHLKANPCHSASGKPRRDFWGFGVSTSCPADESYQEKITLFLEFCNLNWHVVSLCVLSTVGYAHKLATHFFNYFFLFDPEPGCDLCIPLIGVPQQYARDQSFPFSSKTNKQPTKHLKPSRLLPASKKTSSQDTAKI